MNEKRTSIFENGLIWFGAGVSLAEILTGTYFGAAWIRKRSSGNYYWSYHWMHDAFPCRSNWWEDQTKCNGNSKN